MSKELPGKKSTDPFANEDLVTLEVPGQLKVQGVLERKIAGSWRVRVKPNNTALLHGHGYLHVRFAKNDRLYYGKSRVLTLDEQQNTVIVTEPENLDSRPIRADQRLQIQLPAAIIIMARADHPAGFIYRADNCIIDLSFSGMLIACKTPLDSGVKDILVLTCLDQDDAYVREKQVYLPVTKIRDAKNSPLEEFPHSYGFKFRNMFPQIKEMLGEFISTLF